jgi:signal transduction histidine kinase
VPETLETREKLSHEEMLKLFSVLSHDLKSPIFSIDGFSELLIADYAAKMDEDGQDFLRRIRSSAQHMKRVLDEMGHLVKLLSREPVNVPLNLEEIIEELRLKLSAHLEQQKVTLNIEGKLPAIHSDAEMVREILAELLKNAAQFSDQPEGSRQIWITGSETGDNVRIDIRDNGIGIDPRYLDQVFELGIKLDKSRGTGPGYGLFLARRTAALLGGSLDATTEPGTGSTFSLTLPK